MNRASICIFRKIAPKTKHISIPLVPDEIFEAAKRVIETKNSEIIKKMDALYIVTYSESGPFKEKCLFTENQKWLPVHVYKIDQWSSGGITEKQMQDYLDSKNGE